MYAYKNSIVKKPNEIFADEQSTLNKFLDRKKARKNVCDIRLFLTIIFYPNKI